MLMSHCFLTPFVLPTDHPSLFALLSILYWAWWTLGSPFSAQGMSVPHGGSPSVARHLRGRDSNIQQDNVLAVWWPSVFRQPCTKQFCDSHTALWVSKTVPIHPPIHPSSQTGLSKLFAGIAALCVWRPNSDLSHFKFACSLIIYSKLFFCIQI